MSYPTILVHADTSRHAAGRIRLAANLAYECGSHLVGAAMTGISRFVYPDSTMPIAMDLIGKQIETMHERADEAVAMFDKVSQQAGVTSYEHRKLDDEADTGLALQARYADLVVVSQTDPEEPVSNIVGALPEYVMLNSARPVLVVPNSGQFDSVARHALVAWNGSVEATRAITGALPLLKRSARVTVAVFNPGAHYGLHGEQPGADIALYLARHGVKLDVTAQRTSLDIGSALLSMAADIDADLLVMGGYGHPRFRELMLGGVTREILATMTLPVLIAH